MAFISQSNRSFQRLHKEMKDFKDEMKDFKDEMKDFKDEMKAARKHSDGEMKDFKAEMKAARERSDEEMKEFKDEMKAARERSNGEMKEFKAEMKAAREHSDEEMKEFKDEMKEFKIEMRNDHKEMNKKWGDLANKMGTLVEDIIAPAFRPVVEKYFGEEITFMGVNVNKKVKSLNLSGEFDVVGVSASYVFVVDTKSRPNKTYLTDFQKQLISFGKLFPEYGHLKLIPIFASLRFEKAFIVEASKRKIYLLAYREWDYMDFLNFEAVSKG